MVMKVQAIGVQASKSRNINKNVENGNTVFVNNRGDNISVNSPSFLGKTQNNFIKFAGIAIAAVLINFMLDLGKSVTKKSNVIYPEIKLGINKNSMFFPNFEIKHVNKDNQLDTTVYRLVIKNDKNCAFFELDFPFCEKDKFYAVGTANFVPKSGKNNMLDTIKAYIITKLENFDKRDLKLYNPVQNGEDLYMKYPISSSCIRIPTKYGFTTDNTSISIDNLALKPQNMNKHNQWALEFIDK